MSSDILPDSRLKDSNKGVVVADWPLTDGSGRVIRLQLCPIYCFNCGKPNGYVPCDIMSFVSWLCEPCAEKWGTMASVWMSSDQQFWDKVAAEMLDRYGRALTQNELWQLGQQGRLGSLELLIRESPYK